MKRIALLSPLGTPDVQETFARVEIAARRFGIQAKGFYKSDDLISFAPDAVLALSCQDAKLTPYPTYGVMMSPVEAYLRTPRFVRNILTYDGYLTLSEGVKTWLQDVAFGVGKFSHPIGRFACTVPSTVFELPDFGAARLAHVGLNREPAMWTRLVERLAAGGSMDIYGPPGAWAGLPGSSRRGPLPADGVSVLNAYRTAGVGLDLPPSTALSDTIPAIRVIEIVAASAIAITGHHPFLESTFGSTLLYVDFDAPAEDVAAQIRSHLGWVLAHPRQAEEMAREAHRIFTENLAMDRLFPALIELHSRVLVEKGYKASPDKESEDHLPTVTYIMRTGGGRPPRLIRRALDSLVAQNYPKLSVLFVLFREMPEAAAIQKEYPSLGIEVVEDFGGLRSTAICAGMRRVRGELFGLLDDDDYLHPNHVRMLVKALAYHGKRNWRGEAGLAYSGSVEVSDAEPRCEQNEYEDAFALTRRELRSLEHYRVYSPIAMSEHRWYLINTWLARRSLVDEELLNDPMIHTCEDLYVALQIAQRTFLAFSGEVTTVHYFGQHGNSTLQDSERHFPDTLRIATRMWCRPYPRETNYLTRFLPPGRDARRATGQPTDPGANIIGRFIVPGPARRRGGRIALSDVHTREIRMESLKLTPAFYTLGLQFDTEAGDMTERCELEVEVLRHEDARLTRLGDARFRRQDLYRCGDLLCADLHFAAGRGRNASLARFRVSWSEQCGLILNRVMLTQHNAPERAHSSAYTRSPVYGYPL